MTTREGFIQALTRVAKDTLPPHSTLILFGSRARRDDHAGSDWDLLILLDKPSLTYTDYGVGYPFQELGWAQGEEVNPQITPSANGKPAAPPPSIKTSKPTKSSSYEPE